MAYLCGISFPTFSMIYIKIVQSTQNTVVMHVTLISLWKWSQELKKSLVSSNIYSAILPFVFTQFDIKYTICLAKKNHRNPVTVNQLPVDQYNFTFYHYNNYELVESHSKNQNGEFIYITFYLLLSTVC